MKENVSGCFFLNTVETSFIRPSGTQQSV